MWSTTILLSVTISSWIHSTKLPVYLPHQHVLMISLTKTTKCFKGIAKMRHTLLLHNSVTVHTRKRHRGPFWQSRGIVQLFAASDIQMKGDCGEWAAAQLVGKERLQLFSKKEYIHWITNKQTKHKYKNTIETNARKVQKSPNNGSRNQ